MPICGKDRYPLCHGTERAMFFNRPLVQTAGKQGGCPVRPSVPVTTQRNLQKRMQDKCDPTRKNAWGVKLKQES